MAICGSFGSNYTQFMHSNSLFMHTLYDCNKLFHLSITKANLSLFSLNFLCMIHQYFFLVFSRFSLDAEFHLVYFYCFDYLRLCSCILILIMFRLGSCLSNIMISCRSGSRHFTNGIMIGVDKVCSGQKYPCPFLPQNFTD